MATKIRKNDKVVVLSGKEKGKQGIVVNVLNKNKVIVKGINLVSKHQKSIPSRNLKGGVIKKESPISISNISILNLKTGKSEKIGFRFEKGKKIRFLKPSKESLK
ncbi:50S ribosomal protein L24 [Buchnera aphidicola (Tetraneura ulmi)]|uniref:50S ribosomal protein L24 n=1 Tax=Buchnera aphidicola TaxID=9 RepID=UPI0034640F36